MATKKKYRVEVSVVVKTVFYEAAENEYEAEKKAVDPLGEELARKEVKLLMGEYEETVGVSSKECEPPDPRFDIFGYDYD